MSPAEHSNQKEINSADYSLFPKRNQHQTKTSTKQELPKGSKSCLENPNQPKAPESPPGLHLSPKTS